SVTWTVENCELNFGQGVQLYADCNGDSSSVRGSIVVSGTRTITGTITGNAANPVIPESADAVSIKLQTVLNGFAVEGGDGNVLEMSSGTLSFALAPRLAESDSKGVCSIPTSNVHF